MNTQVFYFGYGSNMYVQRLQARVTSAQKVSNGKLLGYRLRLNKVSQDGSTKGNIESANDTDFVLGIMFSISSDQIPVLDTFEGVGLGYNKTSVTVLTEANEEVTCLTYVADPTAINNDILPFDWYINFFTAGAIQNNFPTEYINFLQQFKFKVDTNEGRQEKAKRIMAL